MNNDDEHHVRRSDLMCRLHHLITPVASAKYPDALSDDYWDYYGLLFKQLKKKIDVAYPQGIDDIAKAVHFLKEVIKDCQFNKEDNK